VTTAVATADEITVTTLVTATIAVTTITTAAKTTTVNDLCYDNDDSDVEYLSQLDIQRIYKLKQPLLLPTNSQPTLII
jgi:hypothetical protein